MVLILLEGLDGVGKTFAADYIAERFDAKVVHSSKPKQHPWGEFLPPPSGDVVYDRSFIGERVWSTYFKRETQQTLGVEARLAASYASHMAICINVYAPDDVAIARLDARDEPNPLKHEDRAHVRRLYEEVYAHIAKWMPFTTTTSKVEDLAVVVDNIKRYVELVAARRPPLAWIGNPLADHFTRIGRHDDEAQWHKIARVNRPLLVVPHRAVVVGKKEVLL